MLALDRTYENFKGEMVTKTFYFHLSNKELRKMPLAQELPENVTTENLQEVVTSIAKEKSSEDMISTIESFVADAFGYVSDDGEEFLKDKELTKAFMNSTAFDDLIMDLISDESYLENFLINVVPKKMAPNIKAAFDRVNVNQLITTENSGN